MKLYFAGDDRPMVGETALDCLRCHCHGDHSISGRRGDIDGVMGRLADTFDLERSYATAPTLEARCAAFVRIALERGVLEVGPGAIESPASTTPVVA